MPTASQIDAACAAFYSEEGWTGMSSDTQAMVRESMQRALYAAKVFDLPDYSADGASDTPAQRERNDAINRASENADREWLDAAFEALKYVAQRKAYFTSGDVWRELGERGVLAPREPRAIAGAFARARREGIAEPSDESRQEKVGNRHPTSVRAWASLCVDLSTESSQT